MELSRDDRGLAEISIGYPTRKSSQKLTRQETDKQEQESKYTCVRCRRVFSAPIGKTNHIKHPECQNVDQEETFGGKCRECDRIFRGPADLKQHQQYICADLRRTMPTQNNQDEANREAEGPEKRKRQGMYETANPGETEAEAIKATRSSEMKETTTNS